LRPRAADIYHLSLVVAQTASGPAGLEGRLRNCIYALLVIALAWPHSAAGQTFKPCLPGYREYKGWCVLGEPPDYVRCDSDYNADVHVRMQYCTSAIDSGRHVGEELAMLLRHRAGLHQVLSEFAPAIADYTAAIAALQSVERSVDTKIDVYGMLRSRAEVYEQSGDDRLALADYGEMIRQSPDHAEGWRLRGKLYAKMNDCGRAITDYGEAIRAESHGSADIYLDRALCRATSGDLKGALADCREVPRHRQVSPERKLSDSCDAVIALKLKQFARAAASFAAYVKAHRDDPFALYGRGIARLNGGDRAGGAADIAAAKAMNVTVAASFAGIGITE
jgi:tetratricopeptide (TPR) repeat protein